MLASVCVYVFFPLSHSHSFYYLHFEGDRAISHLMSRLHAFNSCIFLCSTFPLSFSFSPRHSKMIYNFPSGLTSIHLTLCLIFLPYSNSYLSQYWEAGVEAVSNCLGLKQIVLTQSNLHRDPFFFLYDHPPPSLFKLVCLEYCQIFHKHYFIHSQ